ncbi:prepilin-type N-terminal cleavage/methylation domain-containing protein [Candidatus Parcubacteria bacterium]|nr:MAG: prepilin-type N-terminal cleavage/methylation domain-containing protein [Candidatus Parcubacteria bacterium]
MKKQLTINTCQPTNSRGFTLIELIIYIGIVSIILVSVSYLVLEVLSSQSKSYAYLETEQNFRFVQELITTDIKKADDFFVPDDQTLTLYSGTDVINYHFDPLKKITRQKNSEPIFDINTDEVEVQGSFSDYSFLGRSRQVRVNLTINNKNTSGLSDFSALKTAAFAVEIRRRR